MKRIGLTGSIGMGKSTAAGIFRELGIPVHEADTAVHRLLGPGGGAVTTVAAAFPGMALAEGGIDRRKLGTIVFADPVARKNLEKILHPLVQADSDAFVTAHADEPLVVLDIPLLFELGRNQDMDLSLCMTATPEVQRARVLARPGMTAEKFAAILATQMPDAEKRQRADVVIDTGKGLDHTRAEIEKLVRALRGQS